MSGRKDMMEPDNDTSAEVKGAIMLTADEPPKDQWATYEIIRNGEVVGSFKVPFTKEELGLIAQLLEKRNHPHLLKGYIDGGPERQHSLSLQIPHEHGLDDRKHAIDMLRSTAQAADEIVSKGEFTPGLNSREVILAIRDILKPLLSTE